jgi:RNA polymerase sigma factor (sigma-70 family)
MSKALPDVYPIVYRSVWMSFRDDQLAWDATNDACVVALEAPENFEGDQKDLRRWLTCVARRKALDMLKRKHPLPLPNGAEQYIAGEQDPPTLERAESDAEVRQYLARLPAEDQAILHLRLVERLTFREIGDLLYNEDRTPDGRLQHARKQFVKAEADLGRLLLEEGVSAKDWCIP